MSPHKVPARPGKARERGRSDNASESLGVRGDGDAKLITETVGQWLRRLRADRGLGQVEVGVRLAQARGGYASAWQVSVARYETDARTIDPHRLNAILCVYGVAPRIRARECLRVELSPEALGALVGDHGAEAIAGELEALAREVRPRAPFDALVQAMYAAEDARERATRDHSELCDEPGNSIEDREWAFERQCDASDRSSKARDAVIEFLFAQRVGGK